MFYRISLFVICLLFSRIAAALPLGSDDCTAPPSPAAEELSRLVIIMDDLGNNLRRGRQVLALPGNVTYAFIPFTPHGRLLAQAAQDAGKEVMLHAPMSAITNKPLGPGGLTPELSQEDFRATLNAALDEYPQAIGINNHMGSELTQQRTQMGWVMEELLQRGLYFVDSRTSENSIAARVAREFNVPNLSRHVFLDNEPTEEAIDRQFQIAVRRAKARGTGIAIGHPHAATIRYLQKTLPQLRSQGIELAFVSEIIAEKMAARKGNQDSANEQATLLASVETSPTDCGDTASEPDHAAGGAATETATAAPAES